MKKFTLVLSILVFSGVSLVEASSYKISDKEIDAMFDQAVEVNLFESTYISPLSGIPMHFSTVQGEKSNTIAGLLGIFLGWTGIHRWYSDSPLSVWGIYAGISFGGICIGVVGGNWVWGMLRYCTYLPSCVGVVGLVDGIIMLTGSQEEYESKWKGSEKLFNW
jgi:TM2 domain-containing membrane protein YozV